VIIAIAGGSGSGKSTLSNYIFEQNHNKSLLIPLDNYYLNKEEQIKKNGFCNYDHLLSLDKDLLLKNLHELETIGETLMPLYCFKERDRIGYEKIINKDLIIIEGLYAINYLKDIESIKIFVDADSDLLFARRLKRDIKSRDRSIEEIFEQYFNEVKPAYKKYILKQKEYSKFIINNNHDIESFMMQVKDIDIHD
jgi:uridine kinase